MNTPAPTPELIAKFKKKKNTLLIVSIVLDIIGVLTYFMPAIGESLDVAWAPIAGFAMYILYGGYLGVFGGVFVFMEEMLPFTDFIPGFLIMWLVKFVVLGKRTERQFYEEKINPKQVESHTEEGVAVPVED